MDSYYADEALSVYKRPCPAGGGRTIKETEQPAVTQSIANVHASAYQVTWSNAADDLSYRSDRGIASTDWDLADDQYCYLANSGSICTAFHRAYGG